MNTTMEQRLGGGSLPEVRTEAAPQAASTTAPTPVESGTTRRGRRRTLRDSVRGMGYEDGSAALSARTPPPEGGDSRGATGGRIAAPAPAAAPVPAAGPVAPAAPVAAAPVTLAADYLGFEVQIGSWAQIASFADVAIGFLQQELVEIPRPPSTPEAQALIAQLREGAAGWRAMGEQPWSAFGVAQIHQWADEYRRVRTRLRSERRSEATQVLRRAWARLGQQQRAIDEMQPRLQEEQRRAFATGDADRIAAVAEAVQSYASMGNQIGEIVTGIGGFLGTELPAVERLDGILGRIGTVIENATRVRTLLFPGTPVTALDGAVGELHRLTAFAGGAATVLDAIPLLGTYVNDYLVPLTDAIATRLGGLLTEHIHELNRAGTAMGTGIDWSAEPGGEAMGRYMVQVMSAPDAGRVRTPDGTLSEYILGLSDRFRSASGEAVPTSGVDLGVVDLRGLSGTAFSGWVFRHREDLWSSLYGSWDWQEVQRALRQRR